MDWTAQLADQLDFHWNAQLRPRLDGLTDDEYLWEPAPGAWSIRDGGIDWAWPAPDPAPVTTIAWRLAHVIIGCFGARSATCFGGPPVSYDTFPYARTADEALAQLDAAYAVWRDGVHRLGEEGLARLCSEPGWESYPLAEIALLRDLYRARPPGDPT